MGGSGSGRRWSRRKRTTKEYLQVDVGRWQRDGLLREGARFNPGMDEQLRCERDSVGIGPVGFADFRRPVCRKRLLVRPRLCGSAGADLVPSTAERPPRCRTD